MDKKLIDQATEALDNGTSYGNEGGDFAADQLGIASSGTFVTDAEGVYKKYIESLGKKLWYIDGQSWAKTFGHRFSMAFIDPKLGNSINKVLSIDPFGAEDFVDDKLGGGITGAVAGALAPGLISAGITALNTSGAGGGIAALGGATNAAVSLAGSLGVNFDPDNGYVQGLKGFEAAFPNFRHFALPIPPQSVIVRPILPSRVTPTVGGVVEEVSEVKLWSISLSGTTGIAPSQQDPSEKYDPFLKTAATPLGGNFSRENLAKSFRDTIETTGLKTNEFAENQSKFASLAQDSANAALKQAAKFASLSQDSANDALKQAAGEADPGTGNFTEIGKKIILASESKAPNEDLVPPLPYYFSGVNNKSNGFVEAHELQKFFYIYHALKGKHPDSFAMIFSTGKTDQAWRCTIKDFILQQSSENPYLYRYKIDLQCWDVRRIQDYFNNDGFNKPFDRFGPGGDLSPVGDLSSQGPLGNLSELNK